MVLKHCIQNREFEIFSTVSCPRVKLIVHSIYVHLICFFNVVILTDICGEEEIVLCEFHKLQIINRKEITNNCTSGYDKVLRKL